MPFFLDAQETAQRFGHHTSEFRSLLDTNHIPHGSPGNIFEFAKVLESSNQFRLDLSAMVKSVAQREGDELLLTDMMSIIAASVGGSSLADTRTDITSETNTLMEFLLGTGCWRQFGLPSSPISQSATPPVRPPVRTEELSPVRIAPVASAMPIARENPEYQPGQLDATSELREMLTRLEINTQEVKFHLDSIEQRISRIEPRSGALPTPIPVHREPLLDPSSAGAGSSDFPQPVTEDTGALEENSNGSRAVFFSQPERPQTNDFLAPTFAYATDKGKSPVTIGIFLALLAIIAAWLFLPHPRLMNAGISGSNSFRALFRNVLPPAPTATSPHASVPPSPHVAAAPALTSAAVPHPTRTNGETTLTPSATNTSAEPIPNNPKTRYIPANVMEGHLLSAPRPRYPPLARMGHVEGSVALYALISKGGSVETLHVLKGPKPLRIAAIDAARYWRYKPYSVDGRPVEVATTVYVDFSLKPPPEIAR